MKTKQQTKLKEELQRFTGSENYYKSAFGKLKLTDGVNYLRNKADCYWLIDIIESYQTENNIKNIPFQIWTIRYLSEKEKQEKEYQNFIAVVEMKEDTNSPIIINQKLSYTDFPLNKFELWLIDGVLILPSEY